MEKLPVTLKEIGDIITTLIEKVQQLDSVTVTKQQKLKITKEMSDIVDNFRAFFAKASTAVNKSDETTKILKEKIERAFSQFEWNCVVGVLPSEFNKFSESGKSFISSILKLLGAKGCGILIIESYLKLCMKVINDMMNVDSLDLSHDKTKFKLLLNAFSSSVNMFKKYWHISFVPKQKNTIMLCLHQASKGLPFLLKMIEVQNLDGRKYALNILNKCFSKLMDEIQSNGNSQQSSCGQEFITLMDYCLYKLNEISNCINDFPCFIEKANETASSLKPMIDEVLCYVMSIAQVTTFENDRTAIISGSQKVLREFNDLKQGISEENGCAIKLNAVSVGEALCNLERLVNTAVLRLVLEVFSGVNCPLKNIVNKCRTDIEKDNKAAKDLQTLILNFDSEMDRIMQIGLFAVSCTSNLNRILGIQSCLASLESLETELIPSLTTLYMDCNMKNKSNFLHLIDFWLSEITELKILIDSILDPANFCVVVHSQIKSLVVELSSSDENKTKSIVKRIISYSKKLVKTLKTSLEDENEINDKTEQYLTEFQLAVQECGAVLEAQDKEEDTNKILSRALKRCELLLTTLNKLSSHLFDLLSREESEVTEKSSEETMGSEIKIPHKNYYKLCDFAESVSTPTDLEILTPYINKGILRSKKRNILYKTPTQVEKELDDNLDETLLQVRYWDKTPTSRKRSRCCKPLNLNLELGNSLDLEITTILENTSQLSSTFSKSRHNLTCKKQSNFGTGPRGSVKTGKDVACGMDKSGYVNTEKPKYVSNGCCTKFDSPEKGDTEAENVKQAENFVGSKLRSKFLQSLADLSQSASLFATTDGEENTNTDTPDRLNDLKMVEEKINFLKERVPGILL